MAKQDSEPPNQRNRSRLASRSNFTRLNVHTVNRLLSAWYRPPNSELNIINEYELFLFKCDSESKEMIIMGDLNCDFGKSPIHTQIELYP